MRFFICLCALLALFSTVCKAHRGHSHHSGYVYVLLPRRFLIVTHVTTSHAEMEDTMGAEMAQPCLPMGADTFIAEDLETDGECSSVIDTAEAAGLNTLVAAVNAASLTQTLGPDFVGTVFAPTEAAFANLLSDLNVTANELLANTDLLTQVLLIHVVPDVVAMAADLQDGQIIPTAAEGVSLTVLIEEGVIFIVAPSGVRAQVVAADIDACDAVVHVIDAVLTPAG